MDQLISQFAVVSSVLAGFAFTFVGGLLSLSADSKAFVLTFGGALMAAVSLMVAAVCSVFVGLGIGGKFISDTQAMSLHGLASQAFLAGICSFFFAVGSVGWTKGKLTGIISTTTAILGFIGLCLVITPFIRTE